MNGKFNNVHITSVILAAQYTANHASSGAYLH